MEERRLNQKKCGINFGETEVRRKTEKKTFCMLSEDNVLQLKNKTLTPSSESKELLL